jgi:hypothetical protein
VHNVDFEISRPSRSKAASIRFNGWWSTHRRTIVSARNPGPAMPRSIGNSARSGANTTVPSGWTSLGMNFLYTSRSATVAAGRRSSTSRVSLPIATNAPGSRSTSGGVSSIVTRGRSAGSGLRTGLRRVCSLTSCSSIFAAASSTSGDAAPPDIASASSASDSCASLRGRRSAFCPTRPRRNRSTSSFKWTTSFRYSSRSSSTSCFAPSSRTAVSTASPLCPSAINRLSSKRSAALSISVRAAPLSTCGLYI